MGTKSDNAQIGQNAVAANNFNIRAPNDGTFRVSRGNAGAETGDVLAVSATGVLTVPSVAQNTLPSMPDINQPPGYSGFFKCDNLTGGPPTAVAGDVCQHMYYNAFAAAQVWYTYSNGGAWVRSWAATAWTAWARMDAIGSGSQAWQNMTASRALSTIYQNTTSRAIMINVYGGPTNTANVTMAVSVSGITMNGTYQPAGGYCSCPTVIIPHGSFYSVQFANGSGTLLNWSEYR